MKDIVFVQRNWKDDFFEPIAVSASLDDETAGTIRYEIGKEVEWLIRMPHPYDSVDLRLAKIDLLIAEHGDDVTDFDAYYVYRKAFFEYVLA